MLGGAVRIFCTILHPTHGYRSRNPLSLEIERATKRGIHHQTVERSPLPNHECFDVTGDVLAHESWDAMQKTEPARRQEPFFNESDAGEDFEAALRHAARQNVRSMDDLHEAIKACVATLRADGMECEAAIVTIKSCVKHLASKHAIAGAYNVAGSDVLMEQIVRWSIIEFYSDN
jgi:hypothetical protein